MRLLLLPFNAAFKLIELVIKLTGRLAAAIIGFVIMVTGVLLCFTIVGMIIGIPMSVLGFTMMLRGFF